MNKKRWGLLFVLMAAIALSACQMDAKKEEQTRPAAEEIKDDKKDETKDEPKASEKEETEN